MATIGSYEVKLSAISIRNFSLSERPKDFLGKTFNFDLSGDMGVQADKSMILSSVQIDIREGDTKEVLGHISVTYFFELENFDKFIIPNEAKDYYTLPADLEFQLRIIALSTTRGVMYSKFQGTYLAGATLPIISSPATSNSDQV